MAAVGGVWPTAEVKDEARLGEGKYLQEEAELLQITLVSTFDVKPKEFQTMLQGNTFTITGNMNFL